MYYWRRQGTLGHKSNRCQRQWHFHCNLLLLLESLLMLIECETTTKRMQLKGKTMKGEVVTLVMCLKSFRSSKLSKEQLYRRGFSCAHPRDLDYSNIICTPIWRSNWKESLLFYSSEISVHWVVKRYSWNCTAETSVRKVCQLLHNIYGWNNLSRKKLWW